MPDRRSSTPRRPNGRRARGKKAVRATSKSLAKSRATGTKTAKRTGAAKKPPSSSRRPTASARKSTPARRKRSTATPTLARRVGRLVVQASGVAFVLGLGAIAILAYYAQDLPAVGDLAAARKQPRITVLDRQGDVIGIHGQDRGTPIAPTQLPEHVVEAFLATEDRNFYHHVGVNPVAIARAVAVNLRAGGVAQGGSTITQQLVKNLVLSPERTMRRKVQEMLLALKIEAQYDKDEILAFYLNAVYFGNGAYGLEAAARRYFGKHPAELDVGEAAMLAGLLKAPSKFAPTANEEAAAQRAMVVLRAMADTGFLTAKEVAQIEQEGIAQVIARDRRLDYAVDHAVAEARGRLGDFTDDVAVLTTIDTNATRLVADRAAALAAANKLESDDIQVAAIAMEDDGAIRVLIGGRDYGESVYNRATQARRQPGSVFKPFVYLAAVEKGWRPDDIIDDRPVTIGTYQPDNYKDRYYGPVPLTEALSRSLNAAAIRLQEHVGRDVVTDVAHRVGLPINSDVGASLALGVIEATPLDMATAYVPLSNGGYPRQSHIVTTITDRRGEVLYRYQAPETQRVFDPQTLIAFDHMMRHVVSRGSGFRARINGHAASGKTGTSQDSRDAWFAGYASGLVGVVWVGKDDNTPMEARGQAISGSGLPAVLWAEMMQAGLGDRPPRIPTPYVPPVDHKSLFDHLRSVLRSEDGSRDQTNAPVEPSTDPRDTSGTEDQPRRGIGALLSNLIDG